jgi:mannitol/fructose-specific phosphotransferase system IIA component (Ntr-type)
MKPTPPGPSLKVHPLLDEGLILPRLKASDRDGALREMAEVLESHLKGCQAGAIFEKLVQRENLGSTAVGEGYAIPHCKVKSLGSPAVLLAVSPAGLDFGAADGVPTHVFFLTASPAENPGQSLQVLAAVAQLIRRSPQLLKRIRRARSGREIIEAVREEEE